MTQALARRARAAALATLLAAGGAACGQELASLDAASTLRWVLGSNDNAGLPFVIVDKKQARLAVHGAGGRLLGSTPVLLGLAPGDHLAPGSEERPMSQMTREERVTPAGRFVARPGRNDRGEDVIWVHQAAGISMHRVRPVRASERRIERLASRAPQDKRISYGCINVPASFYDRILTAAVRDGAVVYVLPETRPAGEWFGFALQK